MVVERLARGIAGLVSLRPARQFFEGIDECLRIVSGGVLILDSEQISFEFEIAAGFSQAKWDDLPRTEGGGSAGHGERNREQGPGVLAGRKARCMPGGDVSNLMRQECCEFRFVVDGLDQ